MVCKPQKISSRLLKNILVKLGDSCAFKTDYKLRIAKEELLEVSNLAGSFCLKIIFIIFYKRD
ncbi:MAG: hypothetical protein JWQ14_2621 [Adhaeribacter sp.]|nr:hypothetical protein [Adhaeribacter sp.]